MLIYFLTFTIEHNAFYRGHGNFAGCAQYKIEPNNHRRYDTYNPCRGVVAVANNIATEVMQDLNVI